MTSLTIENSYYDQLNPDNYQSIPQPNKVQKALSNGWYGYVIKQIQTSKTFEELIPKKDLVSTVYSIFTTKHQTLINETISKCHSLPFLEDNWGRTPLFWARYFRLPEVAIKLHTLGLHRYFSFNIHPKNLELSVCLFSPRDHEMVHSYPQFLHLGSRSEYVLPIFRELWWQYYKRVYSNYSKISNLTTLPSQYFCATISNSLLFAATNAHPNRVLRQYHETEMVILPTGWHHHLICVVFFKNLMLICNKGEKSSLQKKALQIYRFDPQRLTNNLIEKILRAQNYPKHVSEQLLYINLLQELNVYQDTFCSSVEKQVRLKNQKYDNCTVTSPKVALLGLILCYNQHTTLSPETYDMLRKFYKGFTNHSRLAIVSRYINTTYKDWDSESKSGKNYPLILL